MRLTQIRTCTSRESECEAQEAQKARQATDAAEASVGAGQIARAQASRAQARMNHLS